MKSVLISIQPKWVELIASGEKTIEVRKSRPKLETPFRCYIYCTKEYGYSNGEKLAMSHYLENGIWFDTGKVIGEFVCDKIGRAYWTDITDSNESNEGYLMPCMGESCLSYKELCDYGKGDDLYLWHISDLKIYDKPKELSEFWTIKCTNKRNGCQGCKVKPNCIKTITRPPQSWCYIEKD